MGSAVEVVFLAVGIIYLPVKMPPDLGKVIFSRDEVLGNPDEVFSQAVEVISLADKVLRGK